MSVFINGFKISGYRSFGTEEQTIGPFAKINLIVGQNNSGKSNVLKLLVNHFSHFVKGNEDSAPQAHERFGRSPSTPITFKIGLPPEHRAFASTTFRGNRIELLSNVLKIKPLSEAGLAYFPTPSIEKGNINTSSDFTTELHKLTTTGDPAWCTLVDNWNGGSRYQSPEALSIIQEIAENVTQYFQNNPYDIPQIHEISPNRQIGLGGGNSDTFPHIWDGSIAVDHLARLQNPGSDTISSTELQEDRKKFINITQFFRQVINNPEATLQVSYNRKTILVDMDERVTTLESLGTGLHQVIILAIATTYLDKVIFCIEEPEMNMHPVLQRRLISYWQNYTNNQYFITTHSPALIDSNEDIAVFHLTHNGIQTQVAKAITSKQRRLICDDLGFHPSDLLQANGIIWIEGPSDRIYLNHLIKVLAEDSIQEGIHFTFVFYGGTVRAHYSIEENEPKDEDIAASNFIELLSINRNAIMVADSDLESVIDINNNGHKLRLEREFESYPNGFYWQTQGRTIENYINPHIFSQARTSVHPKASFNKSNGLHQDIVTAKTKKGKSWSANKVAIALKVCENKQPFNDATNVLEQGLRLVDTIRKWNGIEDQETRPQATLSNDSLPPH